MKFVPTNRHILVQPIEEKLEKDKPIKILTPEDYQKPASPYLLCAVHAVSEDSKFLGKLKRSDQVIVERRMLQKIDLQGKSFYLVLENYIYGRFN